MVKDHTFEEHIHNYGVWTAARAASTSRLKNTEVDYLFEKISMRNRIAELRKTNISDEDYRLWIKETGEQLIAEVGKTNWIDFKKKRFSFGLAAKMISIYIKTVEIIPTKGASRLSVIAYPPLDSYILKNVKKDYPSDLSTNWSTFEWKLEVYWYKP